MAVLVDVTMRFRLQQEGRTAPIHRQVLFVRELDAGGFLHEAHARAVQPDDRAVMVAVAVVAVIVLGIVVVAILVVHVELVPFLEAGLHNGMRLLQLLIGRRVIVVVVVVIMIVEAVRSHGCRGLRLEGWGPVDAPSQRGGRHLVHDVGVSVNVRMDTSMCTCMRMDLLAGCAAVILVEVLLDGLQEDAGADFTRGQGDGRERSRRRWLAT
mmetsp:Transcript_2471/g.6642  ORF Transcript_2471/g.6642 Transcript_2471/m.6642 type:complete len:211 (-) Transcript_2471:387-1019(-)